MTIKEAIVKAEADADLVNVIAEAGARDWIRQAAMLIAVAEILAEANGELGRTTIAQIAVDLARRLDPDVLDAPKGLQ